MPPALLPPAFSVVSSSRIVRARDEAQAASLLLESGFAPAEAQRLARDVVEGRLVLVREHHDLEHDELADILANAPMLSALGAQP